MTNIAKTMDSTILNPTATAEDIEALCAEAAKYGFFSVCVNPSWVADAAKFLEKHGADGVKVCSVIDFPFGQGSAKSKAQEAQIAIDAGARELDVVFNVGAYHSGAEGQKRAFDEIAAFQAVADNSKEDVLTKVIIETCYLEDAEITAVSEKLVDLGVDFVKTSTGYGSRGASVNDIKLMAAAVDGRAKVKASGGIGSYEDAKAMLDAGASRIGTSHAAEIADGEK